MGWGGDGMFGVEMKFRFWTGVGVGRQYRFIFSFGGDYPVLRSESGHSRATLF